VKAFVQGDWEGFFSAFINHLVMFLILVALCQGVLGFSSELIYGRILPGVAISFLVGNLFYAWQALRLARREGRDDACALPYGINTPALIAFVFLVMLPAKQIAIAQGASDPERVAWQAGLLACFASGVIEFVTAFFARHLLRVTPRAAMLATLSGIGLGFLALGFILQTYARPLVGLTTLFVVFIVYFGRVQILGRLPGALVVLAIGTLLSWMSGIAPVGSDPTGPLGFYLPVPAIGETWRAILSGQLLPYISIIVPMGLLSAISSLQNLESAAEAGDTYEARSSLVVNGLGTMSAALFGSPFPTSIYIGHPALKAIGARAGYSTLNGIAVSLMCLTGAFALVAWAVPPDAGIAIIVWIGIIIAAQAFEATPKAQMPAVAVGMIPGLAAWATLAVKTGWRSAGYGGTEGLALSPAIVEASHANNFFIDGGFALEQGFIYSAMILAAMTVHILNRQFSKAAVWSLSAALLSALGLMHSWQFTPGDTVVYIPLLDLLSGNGAPATLAEVVPAWQYALAYAIVALLLVAAPWVTRPVEES
jgi:AGZA family xanthine/uracil permease-like MFS transporter